MLGWFFTPVVLCIIKKTSALYQKETEVIIIKKQNYYITEFLDLKGVQITKHDKRMSK